MVASEEAEGEAGRQAVPAPAALAVCVDASVALSVCDAEMPLHSTACTLAHLQRGQTMLALSLLIMGAACTQP